jgi:hypothetical protein
MSRYEPVGKARFRVEQIDGGEQIVIDAPRPMFAMLFLPIWLTVWTIGGAAAFYQVITAFDPFLAIWLCMWALGWVTAAGTLLWMFTGAETMRVTGGDLEIAHRALGFSRRWLYQGSQIRDLAVARQSAWPFATLWQVPFLRMARSGSLKFSYGPRAVYAAAGLDEAEAQLIVERLDRRLSK